MSLKHADGDWWCYLWREMGITMQLITTGVRWLCAMSLSPSFCLVIRSRLRHTRGCKLGHYWFKLGLFACWSIYQNTWYHMSIVILGTNSCVMKFNQRLTFWKCWLQCGGHFILALTSSLYFCYPNRRFRFPGFHYTYTPIAATIPWCSRKWIKMRWPTGIVFWWQIRIVARSLLLSTKWSCNYETNLKHQTCSVLIRWWFKLIHQLV